MKPEQLQDAMTLLPEELLQPVDALRQKKRFPWKSVLATAACFCLVVGLALGYMRIIAPVSAENGAAKGEAEAPMQEAVSDSTSVAPSLVEVVKVEADHIMVVNANSGNSDSCALRAPIKILFTKLPEAPSVEVGQLLELYWHTEDYDPVEHAITPYRIEIVEE